MSIEAALDHWLAATDTGDLPVARAILERQLLQRGMHRTIAGAVASIPRHPFAEPGAWRLAYVAGVEHPLLPAPLRIARALDAARLQAGERVLLIEPRPGWTTIVAGVLAARVGANAATTAPAVAASPELRDLADALAIDLNVPPDASGYDTIVHLQPQTRPATGPPLAATTATRTVLTVCLPGGELMLQRVERADDIWRVVNLGGPR